MADDVPPPLEEQPKTQAPADDVPALEEQTNQASGEQGKKNQSRTEKKSRKALQKLGLKPFSGVRQVMLKQKGQNLVIQEPEVYKSSHDTYVVFGQIQAEDSFGKNKQALQEILKQAGAAGLDKNAADLATPAAETQPAVEEGEVDTTGLSDIDIDLVMKQGNTTKAKAVKALRQEQDVVKAILSLTTQ